jgi:hypothetical protein
MMSDDFHVTFIVGGFAFDGDDPEDMKLMDECLEALGESEQEHETEAA